MTHQMKNPLGAGLEQSEGNTRERTVPARCLTCGQPFDALILETRHRVIKVKPASQDPLADEGGVGAPPVEFETQWRETVSVKHCEPCVAKHHAAEDAKKKGTSLSYDERKKRAFENLCPPVYRTDGIREAMPKEQCQQVTALVKAGSGVLAFGESGSFKTTVLFNAAVRRLIWAGQQVRYIRASEWRQQTSAAAKDCILETWLKQWAEVPWLFLDDIGHMNATPAAEEALLEVLEMRTHAIGTERPRPVLASTQFDTAGLINRFSTPQRGQAICRRLTMLTTPVKF